MIETEGAMTILNEYMSADIPTYGVIILGIVLTAVLMAMCWIGTGLEDVIPSVICGFIGGAVITAMLFIAGVNVEHHYVQATIEDDYPFAEIYEQYEIVSKDGEIYTLREKEKG